MPAEYIVLILLLSAYALAIFLGGLFILDAQRRRLLQNRMQQLGARVAGTFQSTRGNIHQTSSYTHRHLRNAIGTAFAFISRHKLHVLAACTILLIPVGIVLLLQPSSSLQGYDDLPQTADPVILALLRGEQLAPPPPMPPEAFITAEVEAVRKNLAGASREWMILDPDFRQRLLTVFHLMAQKGYPMALLEGYRSPERQAYLAGLGPQVTNAGAYQSFHQFGLAADCAFVRNGKLVISESDPWAMQGYRLYGELAESVGLVWGGSWKMMDFGHVELRKPGTITRAGKNKLPN